MTNISDFNAKHQSSIEYTAIIRGILWDEATENVTMQELVPSST